MVRRDLPSERVLGLLWLTGGLLTLLTLVLPYRVEVQEAVRVAVGAGALVLGAVLWRCPPLPPRATHAVLGLGLIAVTACTAAGIPEIEGVFYLLLLVFVFSTYDAGVAVAYLGGVGVAYALALALGGVLGQVGRAVPWVLVMGVAGVLLVALQAGRRNRRIATALQATLLPQRLPDVPGVELAARYVPAAREADVGGDVFDAFVVGEDRLVLVIGDVAGKGLRAAAAVGQIRTAVRAHALEGASPAAVLDRVERLLDADAPMITLLVAVLEGGELRWASAGHVPPVLVPAHRPGRVLHGPTRPPLGTQDGEAGEAHVVPFAAGDRLVLVTDGLVERRSESLEVGLERLRDAVAAGGPGAAAALEAALGVAPRRPDDDVAVLVAVRR